MLKYFLICFGTLAVLSFLKCIEDSPVRSWKAVFFASVPLAAILCYYVHWAYPPPPPPVPEKRKIANYRNEMERTIRHIAGVRKANIEGSRINIDFGSEISLQEMRRIALHSGGAAAHFMQPAGTNITVTIHVTVVDRDRLEIQYDSKRGVLREQVFD